jgi:outer membrane protein TolC
LNDLLARAEKNSPSARIALARLDQSRAMLRIKRADILPGLSADSLWSRENESGDSFYKIYQIMQNIKKYTAKEANKILNRKGK